MGNSLLDAAFAHYDEGRRIISVNQYKTPYFKGWKKYFETAQTEEELRQQFSNGAYGLALILFPGCPYGVLDHDGPHAKEAWQTTGIELPETARNFSRSGYDHLFFRMPADTPAELKRGVRLVEASCDCKDSDGEPDHCGVDFLVNGIVILPPTPGYREDPNRPLESAVLMPQAVIELALKKQKEEKERPPVMPMGKVNAGKRKIVACSLAGSMRARGMSIEAIRAALKADSQARFNPPLEDEEIEDVMKSAEKWEQGNTESEHLTDLGNARRFAQQHGGTALFSEERRSWNIWSGKLWLWDKTKTVSDLAEATIQSIYAEAAVQKEKEIREAISNHAIKSEARGKIEAMLVLAQGLPAIRADLGIFDQHPFLLNAGNCTIELENGSSREFSREDYLTKIMPTEYDPDALCQRWETFLTEITEENTELVNFLQRSVGYSLTGSTKEQCFWLLFGNGSNGKTTFVETIMALMGEYGAQIKTEILLESRYEQKDYHLAELCGKRFIAACESNMGRRMAAGLVKQATGEEQLPARSPYGKPFSFYPEFKIWLSTNHRPRVDDPSDALWRRIYAVPFNVKYVKQEEVSPGHPGPFIDRTLKEQLRKELPGILNWAIEGCREWQRLGGLCPPKIVLEATKQYRDDEDIIGKFIEENYQLDPASYVLVGEIYKKYVDWCKENGEKAESNTAFGTALNDKGFRGDSVKHESSTKRVRWGLRG